MHKVESINLKLFTGTSGHEPKGQVASCRGWNEKPSAHPHTLNDSFLEEIVEV